MTAEVRALRPSVPIPAADAPKAGDPLPKKGKRRLTQEEWDAVEQEYRAGVLSVSHIARMCGMTPQGVAKRAKAEGWKRDLTGAVRQRTKIKLLEAEAAPAGAVTEVTDPNARDDRIVDAAASRQVAVITEHRQDIARIKDIARLLGVNLQRALRGEIAISEVLGEKETAFDAMTKLARATRDYQTLDRQAWNLDSTQEQIKPFVTLASRRGVPGVS